MIHLFTSEDVRKRVNQIMADAFPPHREPKSPTYLVGVRSVLLQRLSELEEGLPISVPCPYPLGTTAADAWLAGRSEGKEIARGLGLLKRLAAGVQPAAKLCRRLHAAAPDLLDLVQAIQAEVDDDVDTPRISADSYLPPSLRAALRLVIVQAGGRLAPTTINPPPLAVPRETHDAP